MAIAAQALIQLSARHKSDDHFWFSFFHEAAHLLLHSKKHIYVDSNLGTNTNSEAEADIWASNFLITPEKWGNFRLRLGLAKQPFVDLPQTRALLRGSLWADFNMRS